ncbi:ABC transporter permease [Balneatrix alpica]|uniref:ABC transporter permease n=1 Tax=Balneatrix alpica TaxID=75684 RepID=A0ABV5ZDH4_9GAMM|nr:ABC transporter permease [Balneatrix alpica]
MDFQPYHRWGDRLAHYAFVALCSGVLLFLLLPILVVIPLSFSSDSFLSYPIPGWSLRWYAEVLNSSLWQAALKNSLIIGAAATLLATLLGTLAALGMQYARFPGQQLMLSLMISPMVVPLVIAALGLYFFFAEYGLNASYTGLILAHTLLGAPFVLITVNATLQGFDRNLMRAAASLGANPLRTFFKVVLPLILPGVISGALFAFATSFDEVIVALFTAGPEQRTLPRQMFDGIRENITPAITAVATLLTLFALLLLSALEALRRRGEKLQSRHS